MRTTKLIILSLIATLASFGQCVLVFNPLTNQFNCGGGAAGGSVGGASNLTTVGAIPYVSAAGILNQDPTALFWDAANNRLGVGTASPSFLTHFVGISGTDSGWSRTTWQDATNATRSNWINGVGFATIGTITADPFVFVVSNTESFRIAAATRNLLIGTTTESNFKLDVAASGSAGTARFWGGAGVSNSTKVVVQAGAGQSTTNLTEWQNSAGTVLASVGPDGYIASQIVYDLSAKFYLKTSSGLELGSAVGVKWSSSTTVGTLDLGLSRSSAGLLEINSGTAGTYRDLILRRSQHNGVTVADLPTAAAGNAGSIQYVTDANATTIGSTVAGGGANKVMVWSDGAAWKIFAN